MYYRASLLGEEVLAVAVDDDCDCGCADQPTTLHVCSVVDSVVHTTDFYGSSLDECVSAAAAALGFECVTTTSPSGTITRRRIAIEVDEDAITFRAKMRWNRLLIYESEDDDEGDDSYLRLMAVEMPDGKRELFKGKTLYDCVAAARRYIHIASFHFVKLRGDNGDSDSGGGVEPSEAQKYAGWA